jgi:hypothetical protein
VVAGVPESTFAFSDEASPEDSGLGDPLALWLFSAGVSSSDG